MKEESFVSEALNLANRETGRWVANQATFNLPDQHPIDERTKAPVITALEIFNHEPLVNELDGHIERALAATTHGEIRQIIAEVDDMLSAKR